MKAAETTGYSQWEKILKEHWAVHYTIEKTELVKYLNVRSKTIKILKEKMGFLMIWGLENIFKYDPKSKKYF